MSNLNKIFLIGRLTRDPELRYTPQGVPVSDLGLAVNREYTVGTERRKDTLFIDVTVWRKLAEICSQYLKKGRTIFVEGRLSMDSWDSQEGQRRVRYRVIAENVQFLDSGRRGGEEGAGERPLVGGVEGGDPFGGSGAPGSMGPEVEGGPEAAPEGGPGYGGYSARPPAGRVGSRPSGVDYGSNYRPSLAPAEPDALPPQPLGQLAGARRPHSELPDQSPLPPRGDDGVPRGGAPGMPRQEGEPPALDNLDPVEDGTSTPVKDDIPF